MKQFYIIVFVVLLLITATSLTLFHENNQSPSNQIYLNQLDEETISLPKEQPEKKTPRLPNEKPEKKVDNIPKETSDGSLFILKDYGPTEIKAGEDFNQQPNGESAIWAHAENVTSTTILVLNHQALISFPYPDKKLVTAFVPSKLYASQGEYPLYLLDTQTNKKSNELQFTVK